MPKKKLPQTIEECNAELERTQKLLQQYENRSKMLDRKLSAEKRKERNHRIFVGRKPFRKLGVFFLGHACLDYPAAVRRVVSFSHGKTSFLCVVSSH